MKIKDLKEYKGYVIITEYFEQYALGITGVHRHNRIITNNGRPFQFKKDAMEFAKLNGIKSRSVKGTENEGYGSIGAISFRVSYVKTSELGSQHIYHDVN